MQTHKQITISKTKQSRKHLFLAIWSTQHTIKNKIKASLKNRINLKSIKTEFKKKQPLNKKCKNKTKHEGEKQKWMQTHSNGQY